MKVQDLRFGICNYLGFALLIPLFIICFLTLATASDKWQGVDESVVERFAKEYGRQPQEPLINTDQGDLQLFLFLIAGAISGFVAGYYWRELTANIEHKKTSGSI